MLSDNKKIVPGSDIIPTHIGIIMDGNGRWAKKRGLPRKAGHTAGAKTFRKIARYCSDIGVKYLTVYAFSTENWNRPEDEVSALMKLFKQYLEEAISDFSEENVRLKLVGDITGFSKELRELIEKCEKGTENKTGMTINLAMNYGGRNEIVSACRKIAEGVKNGDINPEEIDDKMISDNLYTSSQPDPDLIIRPSGEKRISNFLLWQAAYSEFVYLDVLWPDFETKDLDAAILEFAKRNRRFGGV